MKIEIQRDPYASIDMAFRSAHSAMRPRRKRHRWTWEDFKKIDRRDWRIIRESQRRDGDKDFEILARRLANRGLSPLGNWTITACPVRHVDGTSPLTYRCYRPALHTWVPSKRETYHAGFQTSLCTECFKNADAHWDIFCWLQEAEQAVEALARLAEDHA